jgi:hypothetical protein
LSYRYDVFLSYRRSWPGNAGRWVRNHFHRLLVDCLSDQLDWEPKVFFDLEAETGSHWPSMLEDALLHSKMLVGVWSPPYFRSAWCLAEWKTMLAREQIVAPARPAGLVYPVVFSDKDNFPPAAQNRQDRRGRRHGQRGHRRRPAHEHDHLRGQRRNGDRHRPHHDGRHGGGHEGHVAMVSTSVRCRVASFGLVCSSRFSSS